MKLLSFRSLPLALGLAVLLAIPPPASAEEAETELGKKMEDIGGAWRKVRRAVADGTDGKAAADIVAGMLKNAKASEGFEPVRMQDVPEAERAAFLAGYKKEMKAFIEMLGKLEAALRAGRAEEATKLVADIGAHQRASHKEYKRPDK